MSFISKFKLALRPQYYISLNGDAQTSVLNYSARDLYQTQDNLKAVVDFLSNSIAQLPLKCYVRDGENERRRDRDSNAARLLHTPNPDQTAYEFIRGLVMEFYLFGNVYVWIIEDKSQESGYQLRLIPNEWVKKSEGDTVYSPDYIEISANGQSTARVDKEHFVQFKTYAPGNPGSYVSPMSALRATLQEQIEAGRYRKDLWHSSGRLNAQIIRPKDVQPWDDESRKKFIKTFREAWGSGGSNAGKIPLLEDGMEIKPFSASFKEQQWAESVKLSREAVAAAYRVNPSLIWHTDTQTYASSKDNARALYAECLGPDLQMLQQRINTFLLPKIGAEPNLYVEFDLAEKLKGSFEERASILQSAVGAPYMTRNEARASENLPPIEGGDNIIVPLNLSNGTDNPAVEEEKCSCGCHTKSKGIRIKGVSTDDEAEEMQDTLKKYFERQSRSLLPKLKAKADWWDGERWDKELADDINPIIQKIADKHGIDAGEDIGFEYNTAQTEAYLRKISESRAREINRKTKRDLDDALDEDNEEFESPSAVFDKSNARAVSLGMTIATQIAGWSVVEAGSQAKYRGDKRKMYKEWVTGPNPRSSHASMNGQKVEIDDTFSNGAYWPGDDNLDADESCGCNCHTDVIIE